MKMHKKTINWLREVLHPLYATEDLIGIFEEETNETVETWYKPWQAECISKYD